MEEGRVNGAALTDAQRSALLKAGKAAGLEAYREYVPRVMRNSQGTKVRGYDIGTNVAESMMDLIETIVRTHDEAVHAIYEASGKHAAQPGTGDATTERTYEDGVRAGIWLAIETLEHLDGRSGKRKAVRALNELLSERTNPAEADQEADDV